MPLLLPKGAARHLEVHHVLRGLRLPQAHCAVILRQVAAEVVSAGELGMKQHVHVFGGQGVIAGVLLLLVLLLLRVMRRLDLLPLVLVQTAVRRRGACSL